MVQPETGDVVVDALLAAAHRIRTATDARLREEGLSLTRYKALRALAAADGSLSMSRLSESLGLAARSVTDVVCDLEKAGLLTRAAHPSDRRVSLLTLTAAGGEALAAAARAAADVATAFTAGLDAAERERLLALLRRLG